MLKCQHCTQPLTGKRDTFGDGDILCAECNFQLIDLQVELKDALAELKTALTVVEAARATTGGLPLGYYAEVKKAEKLEADCQIIQGAIYGFCKHAPEGVC